MPDLKAVLDNAYQQTDALHSCSHFVWHVIQAFKPSQPYMTANSLVIHLAHSAAEWEAIDKSDSRKMAELASKGALIVGGRNNGTSNGHVIVVYPGNVKPMGGYSYQRRGRSEIMRTEGQYARAISRSMGNWPGAVSDGDKTIRDPWSEGDFNTVKFWVYIPSKPRP